MYYLIPQQGPGKHLSVRLMDISMSYQVTREQSLSGLLHTTSSLMSVKASFVAFYVYCKC